MEVPTLEEFVESKYAEEIHRAIVEDSIINGIMNKMSEYVNTRKLNQIPMYINANINQEEVKGYQKKLEEFKNIINNRMMQVKNNIIKSKLNSDMTVRAEYMEYINENFTDSESLKATALMFFGEAAIRTAECLRFADVSIQPKFNIADKHPKEFVFRDGRIDDMIQEYRSHANIEKTK